jgi:hypothetical protein
MLLYIPDQLLDACALVIPGALVMNIAEGTLDRVCLRTVGWQEDRVFPVSAVDFPFASVFELSSEGESCVMLAVGGASRLRRASAIHRAVAKHSL